MRCWSTRISIFYGTLVVWLFRVWRRKLGRKTALLSIPSFTILAGVLLLSVVVGAWGWNWEHVQRYQVSYTSNFHLVVEITPIGGEAP